MPSGPSSGAAAVSAVSYTKMIWAIVIGFVAFGWMTRGQMLCLPMIAAGLAMFAWAQRRAAPASGAPVA